MMKNFSPKFPIYSSFSLAQVTRAACCGNSVDQDALLQQAEQDRSDILQNLFSVATALGPEGMLALDRMVTVPPSGRTGCDTSLESPFFSDPSPLTSSEQMLHPVAQLWLHGRLSSPGSPERRSRPRMDDTPPAVLSGSDRDLDDLHDTDCPPVTIPSSLIPSQMVWSILNVMQQHERTNSYASGGASGGDGACLPRLPPGFDAGQRAVLIDFIIGLANTLSLRDYTLHLAASVVDKYLSLQDEPLAPERLQVVGATCLKVSDVFAEQSKEYYKQENAVEYAEASLNLASSAQMLLCEKDMLPKLDFNLHQPTVHWFVQCYLAYGRFTPAGQVAKTAFFIGDLMLLDYELLAYPPSLKAQCALLLAVFLVQQAQASKLRPPTPATAAATPAYPSSSLVPCVSADRKCGFWAEADLSYLEHWDDQVRDRACRGNAAVDASMCLQAVVKALVEKRRGWKSVKLNAVETKHAALARMLVYPERFPVSKLVRYILPDCQRGLIPE